MAECQVCGAAVIVARPFEAKNGTWLLVCNKCLQNKDQKVFVDSTH